MRRSDFTQTKTRYGGIYRREWANGRVSFKATLPPWTDSDGRRHQPSRSFARLEEARAWRAERVGQAERGVRTPTGRVTLGEYLDGADGWLARYGARNPGNTAANYRQQLRKHLKPLKIWRARLLDIEPEDISAAYDRLPARSVRPVHVALHRALQDAVPKLIPRNPATGARRDRRSARPERIAWTLEEYRAFLASAEQDRLFALWLLLGQSGMRVAEALGLDWPAVSFDGGTVAVVQQFTRVESRSALVDVKTARSRRTVDLDGRTVAVLRGWKKQQAEERLAATRWADEDGLAVFTRTNGARVAYGSELVRRFHAIRERAGARRIDLHDLRHTHATLLLRQGAPVNVVSRRLGHASEAFTLARYAHVLPDMARHAADVAGDIAGD